MKPWVAPIQKRKRLPNIPKIPKTRATPPHPFPNPGVLVILGVLGMGLKLRNRPSRKPAPG